MTYSTDQLDPAVRREQLLLRSAQLRERIGSGSRVLQPGFRAVDRVRGGVAAARDNNGLLLLAGSVVVGAALVRPRMVASLGMRLWSGWHLVRRLQPLLRRAMRYL